MRARAEREVRARLREGKRRARLDVVVREGRGVRERGVRERGGGGGGGRGARKGT